MTSDDINKAVVDQALIAVTGKADCDVTVYKIQYNTVGAAVEATTASAAVFVPTGGNCTGARALLEYARGTNTDKAYDLTDTSGTESTALLGLFATRGYLVVAPNYTGFDTSTLPYHPYLVGQAQSSDMVDALRATKAALPAFGATVTSQLFVTGYSQGGYVAMATHRAIQNQYASEFTVTASAGNSGPYALQQFIEGQFNGGPQSGGASLYFPMLLTAYQKAYNNLYTDPSQVYQPPFNTFAPTLLPSTDPNAKSRLPGGADDAYRTLFDAGDGQPFLLTTAFRQASAPAASALSLDLAQNDLTLDWTPAAPVALCYGDQDPVVFPANAVLATTAFSSRGATVTRYNLEDTSTVGKTVHDEFELTKAIYKLTVPSGAEGDRLIQGAYHAGLVSAFCLSLTRDFFDNKRN